MTNTITITTTNRDLWGAFFEMNIEGAKQIMPLEKKDFGEYRVYKIVIAFASGVAINMFSSWLYDQMKSHPEGTTQIENQPIAHDRAPITTIIGEKVIINHYDCKEEPDEEGVAEELP